MARMTARSQMGQFAGSVSPTTQAPAPKQPDRVAQKPWNVKGDAGIPCGDGQQNLPQSKGGMHH